MADSKTVVAPFSRPTDVTVIMDVTHPQPIQGLGNMLILNFTGSAANNGQSGTSGTPAPKAQDAGTSVTTGTGHDTTPTDPDKLTDDEMLDGVISKKTDKATGAVYRVYRNVDALAKHGYDEDSDVYKKASAYFAQDNHSDRISVLDLPVDKMRDALGAFWYFDWTFAILSKPMADANSLTDLSNIFEANKDHFLVIQSNDPSSFVKLTGQNYTIGLVHDVSEPMDSAFVGAIAMLPIGSTNWKFKTLNGITPDTLTVTELDAINRVHAIGYETVFGKNQTSSGKVLSGEYIDTLHGVIWVKTRMETSLEKLLQDNNKVPYEQRGINMVLATGTQVLNEASERGIILNDDNGKPEFTITASGRDQQSAQDLSDRHYGGLSFTYHASSAIDSITVHGVVNSDTILTR